MLTLTDREALRRAIRDPTLDPHLRCVLALRLDQPGAEFHVAGSTDTLADAEAAVGFPMIIDEAPCWEWTQCHPGGVIEVVFVLSDDGPAQVLLVPENADAAITGLLREHAAD